MKNKANKSKKTSERFKKGIFNAMIHDRLKKNIYLFINKQNRSGHFNPHGRRACFSSSRQQIAPVWLKDHRDAISWY